jgi:hypothetical protein
MDSADYAKKDAAVCKTLKKSGRKMLSDCV